MSMTAFRQGVEAMIPALRRYARALARDADIADDLVQDTLVRALRSEKLFLGGDVRSWLYTILTNLNKNRRRSLARRPRSEEHTSELQSLRHLVCRLLLEKKKRKTIFSSKQTRAIHPHLL